MKFTMSSDGVERATIRVALRLTADDIAEAKRLAKVDKVPWRQWIEGRAALGVETDLVAEDGAMEQRYGRGGD